MSVISYKSMDTKRKFGVEFEVGNNLSQSSLKKIVDENSTREVLSTNWSQSINNDYWHVKTDSTCGPQGKGFDSGFEVASYVASGTDIIDIATMAEALQRNGATVNNNCGFHVHVDVSDFDEEHAGTLVVCWLQIEHWLKQMVPNHRKKNKYCKFTTPSKFSIRKAFYENLQTINLDAGIGKSFWKGVKPNNFSPYENSQRKVAFNLVNLAAWLSEHNKNLLFVANEVKNIFEQLKLSFTCESPSPVSVRPTVEFRFPEGTLDRDNVINWVRLFVLFVEMAKNSPLPKSIEPQQSFDQFLCFLGLQSDAEFYLFDEDLHNLKMWIMDRIIRFGAKKYAQQVIKKYEIFTC